MKIAPLMHELKKSRTIQPILVHTGQHYDEKMSDLIFKQLDIPEPDINLEVGSASHAVQTARIMERFEKVCLNEKPDMVLVVGDVNSTAACTLVASKLHIKTCHYEAGLRSRDKSMPEEINRLVTDAICDLFLTTSSDASENLLREGVDASKVHMVGNLMIDSLQKNLVKAERVPMNLCTLEGKKLKLGLDFEKKKYGLMTFHRPSNVDDKKKLEQLVNEWASISQRMPTLFPIHPRTLKKINQFGFLQTIQNYPDLHLFEPMGYLQFVNLIKGAAFVLTDSGGVQEETTFLSIPCLTVRPNTERPITIYEGTNKLIKAGEMTTEVDLILMGKAKPGQVPKYWDGQTAKRIQYLIAKEVLSEDLE